jgi:hypothetical protein
MAVDSIDRVGLHLRTKTTMNIEPGAVWRQPARSRWVAAGAIVLAHGLLVLLPWPTSRSNQRPPARSVPVFVALPVPNLPAAERTAAQRRRAVPAQRRRAEPQRQPPAQASQDVPAASDFVVTAPEAPRADSAPPLDLTAARARAVRETVAAARAPAAPANAEPAQRALENQLAKGVSEVAREPCLTAHRDAGLLAPLLVLADTVRDKGCRW